MDKTTIRELSKLCRIECTEEEEEKFLKDLQGILNYFDQLSEVDTDGIEPMNHVLEAIVNVEREDVVKPSLPRDVFLSNAPSQIGGMIKVPTVIKGA